MRKPVSESVPHNAIYVHTLVAKRKNFRNHAMWAVQEKKFQKTRISICGQINRKVSEPTPYVFGGRKEL